MFAWKFSFILLLASFCFANVSIQNWASISGGNTIATDYFGNNFVSSSTDNVIYQIVAGETSVENIVYAGTGTAGFLDGPLTTAQFNQPMGITVSRQSGYMYVCDYGNNALRRISGGNVITVATGISQPIQVISQDYHGSSNRVEAPLGVYVLTASGQIIVVDDSPLNDICDFAVNIDVPVGSFTINGTTVNARGNLEYVICNALDSYYYDRYSGQAGVWYTMYGNGNSFTISTCNSGTSNGISVFVYRDSSPNVSTTCSSLVCMTVFDGYYDNGQTCLHSGGSTEICTQEGILYYFYVNSFTSEEGPFVLTITNNGAGNCSSCACNNQCGSNTCFGYCPDTCTGNTTCIDNTCVETIPNENCANAIELVGNTTASGDLSKVSTLPPVVIAEGDCDFLYQGGYWFSFNATVSNWVTLSFCNEDSAGAYPYAAVYAQIPGIGCTENLLCVPTDSSYCQSFFTYDIFHFCPVAGTTYFYYVTSFDSRHTFSLEQTISSNPCTPGEGYYGDTSIIYYTSFA